MKYTLLILSFVVSLNCDAVDSPLEKSVDWLKQWVPEKTNVRFEKYKVSFEGVKHKEYSLDLAQPINSNIAMEASVSHMSGKLNWGVFAQKIKITQFSLIPRYQFASGTSVGMGMKYQSKPELSNIHGLHFDLPQGKTFVINTRLPSIDKKRYWELALASQSWRAQSHSGTWFTRGRADTRVTMHYKGNF